MLPRSTPLFLRFIPRVLRSLCGYTRHCIPSRLAICLMMFLRPEILSRVYGARQATNSAGSLSFFCCQCTLTHIFYSAFTLGLYVLFPLRNSSSLRCRPRSCRIFLTVFLWFCSLKKFTINSSLCTSSFCLRRSRRLR